MVKVGQSILQLCEEQCQVDPPYCQIRFFLKGLGPNWGKFLCSQLTQTSSNVAKFLTSCACLKQHLHLMGMAEDPEYCACLEDEVTPWPWHLCIECAAKMLQLRLRPRCPSSMLVQDHSRL